MKHATRSNRAGRCLPAIVAVGSSIAALPAEALELGELTVQSRLGQPLRASIAFALAPHEQISDYCVSLRTGPSVSGLPGFGPARINVTNGVIMLSGTRPVREPMVSAHVAVDCPYSANLSREYLLFIDPMAPAYDQQAVSQQAGAAATDTGANPLVDRGTTQPPAGDIAATSRYRVMPGDTLSAIAARIDDRPVGLWPAANAIFAANPEAFVNNDINRLKAGAWLSIPDFDGTETTITSPRAAAAEPAPAPATATAIVDAVSDANRETPVQAPTPAAARPDSTVIIDAAIESPKTTATNPNVPTAIIVRTPQVNDGAATSSWFVWLAGAGAALLAGLVLFARRFRDATDAGPAIAAGKQEQRRDRRMNDTENAEPAGVDFDLSDDSPTEENLVLDADLVMGTGLNSGVDSDDRQDFGFAATSNIDLELPFEPLAHESDQTDMLPPLRASEQTILESEVLPDDDDYDMSVIVDATKMPLPEDVTERDLKAVEVTPVDDITQQYTINNEVDFQVLEQDYEDELTATQALNEEIARAAAELADHMHDIDDDADMTAALPLASVTEQLDISAQMPAQNDSDADRTDVNEQLAVEMPTDDDTVSFPFEKGKRA